MNGSVFLSCAVAARNKRCGGSALVRQGIAEPGGQAGVEVIDVEAGGLHEANCE